MAPRLDSLLSQYNSHYYCKIASGDHFLELKNINYITVILSTLVVHELETIIAHILLHYTILSLQKLYVVKTIAV
jgi:predicted SprT family Zn-dependent metalloprotease